MTGTHRPGQASTIFPGDHPGADSEREQQQLQQAPVKAPQQCLNLLCHNAGPKSHHLKNKQPNLFKWQKTVEDTQIAKKVQH